MMDRPEFGAALLRCREARRLTQRELGALVGLDQSTISRLEWGDYRPSAYEVSRLEDALAIPSNTLACLAVPAESHEVFQQVESRNRTAYTALRALAIDSLITSALGR